MNDEISNFSEHDPRMELAINEAKSTLKHFFDTFANRKQNQNNFLLKVRFENDGEVEHILVANIDANVFPLEGTVANEPNIKNIEFKQRISFHQSEITDWMYLENGYLVGGFTIQVIRSSLSQEEKAEHDANAPYKFKGFKIQEKEKIMNKQAVILGVVVSILVLVPQVASYILFYIGVEKVGNWGWYSLSLTMVVTMLVTLFGVLALPGGLSDDGSYREQRIRFAIAATLVAVYFVLFSNAVLWGNSDQINGKMMDTLTQLMTIVLPFYFGTSGLVEWGKMREARKNKQQ